METVLNIENLKVVFHLEDSSVTAVEDFSFSIKKGEIFALVGESGSGKSVCALSITGLMDSSGAKVERGSVVLNGTGELTHLSNDELRQVRGGKVAYIFQEPMTSLNPLHTVIRQISERMTVVDKISEKEAKERALTLLKDVGIRDIENRTAQYPHQFSGGERQRVMIAMALAGDPDILIADEPTTALDVTVQKQILDLIRDVSKQRNMSVLLITHDLGVVKEYAERAAVVKNGLVVESGTREKLFTNPESEYTKQLLRSLKQKYMDIPDRTEKIMEIRDFSVTYNVSSKKGGYEVHAVKDVSFELFRGESLGIVGESGSGKSSLVRGILRLTEAEGYVNFRGVNLIEADAKVMRSMRRDLQIVFQDPYGSLNPRMTASMIVSEGLKASGIKDKALIREKVLRAFADVKLDPNMYDRYPHEFSGGQRQRIAIARAIVLQPEVIFLDEATSSLDRLVQVQILDLLKSLQSKYGLTYVFISHDLGVVRTLCQRTAVMKDGVIVEFGTTKQIFGSPEHPYTKALIEAAMTF